MQQQTSGIRCFLRCCFYLFVLIQTRMVENTLLCNLESEGISEKSTMCQWCFTCTFRMAACSNKQAGYVVFSDVVSSWCNEKRSSLSLETFVKREPAIVPWEKPFATRGFTWRTYKKKCKISFSHSLGVLRWTQKQGLLIQGLVPIRGTLSSLL